MDPNGARRASVWTPLQLAALRGETDLSEFPPEDAAYPEEVRDGGMLDEACAGVCATAPSLSGAPLCLAALRGHAGTVRALLRRGASGAGAALVHAGRGGATEAAEALLDAGASVEARAGQATALFLASQGGHLATASLLLDRGARVNSVASGAPALLIAAEIGHTETARLLLDRGADVNGRATDGSTPLLMAAQGGCEATVRLLLERGADVDAVCLDNVSALTSAVHCGHEKVVRLLLEVGGANPNPRDGDSRNSAIVSAYHSALHQPRIAALLVQHGALVPRFMWSAPLGMVMAMVAEGGAPVSDDVLDAQDHVFPDSDTRAFLTQWRDGTHPLQAERRAMEAALLSWRWRSAYRAQDGSTREEVAFFPADLVTLAGDFVHAQERRPV